MGIKVDSTQGTEVGPIYGHMKRQTRQSTSTKSLVTVARVPEYFV